MLRAVNWNARPNMSTRAKGDHSIVGINNTQAPVRAAAYHRTPSGA